MADTSTHALCRLERADDVILASCACGWQSLPVPTATHAGTAWDSHVRNVDAAVLDIAALERRSVPDQSSGMTRSQRSRQSSQR